MKSITIASLVAVLASISAQALPVRVDVDAAPTYGSQLNPDGLSELVERQDPDDPDPYDGIPVTNPLDSDTYEDGTPKDPNAPEPVDDTPPEDTETQDPPDDTQETKPLDPDVDPDTASLAGDFIGIAAAGLTTTAAADHTLNAYDVLSAAAATNTP